MLSEREKQNARRLAQYRRNQEIKLEHKLANPCVDCNESDPALLEFDHRDPSVKRFNLGMCGPRSEEMVRAEIAKCDMRCRPCHRKKTLAEKQVKGSVLVRRVAKYSRTFVTRPSQLDLFSGVFNAILAVGLVVAWWIMGDA